MTRCRSRRSGRQLGSPGFSLLEVIVAVAILAVALSAIFSSEAGAIKVAHRARTMGLASLLARCKMAEIEEQVLKEGMPAEFDSGRDGCCEDAELDGFACKWSILRVKLPETLGTEAEQEEESPLSAVRSLNPLDPTGAATVMGVLGGGSHDMIAELAMQYTYPILRPAFEEQIRRATVSVEWKEGKQPHSLDVVQFLVATQPPFPMQPAGSNVPGAPSQ